MLSTTCPTPVHICEKRTKKAACFIASRFVFGVEVAGFEPAAFWSRTKRATKLRYTPENNGANEGARTLDLQFTKLLLCQLSYIGLKTILHLRKAF